MKGNFAKMAVADLSDLNSKRYVNTPDAHYAAGILSGHYTIEADKNGAALLLDTVPLRAPRRCPPA
ncbi:MAG: hypothetical protein M0033_09885 [Nitrospiraceae bacterium]|nr:hypothetical protein [Nitrospiraceae bacterium]